MKMKIPMPIIPNLIPMSDDSKEESIKQGEKKELCQEIKSNANKVISLTPNKLEEAIIISEIIGKPMSKRRKRNYYGY